MNVKLGISVGLLGAGVLWASAHIFFHADSYVIQEFAPKPSALVLYAVAAALVIAQRDAVLRLFGALWLMWPIFGSYFTIGTYYQHKLWAPTNLDSANIIYLFGIIMLLLGQHAFLFFRKLPLSRLERYTLQPINAAPLLVFPALFGLSLYLTGSILLGGGDILNYIYTVDRGPFYAFRLALPMSALLLYLYYRKASGSRRALLLFSIIAVIAISMLDGKRDMALLAVASIICTIVLESKRRQSIMGLAALFITIIVTYGAIGNLRADRDVGGSNWIDIITIAGTEYREFSYSINYWSPEYMETLGYDFTGSMLGALLNRQILAVFGLNKDELVSRDSARTWQAASSAEFGIRTGLISELYYGFPSLWPIFMAIFGAISASLRVWMQVARTDMRYIVATTFFSALIFAMMSQSSATFGYVATALYIVLAMKLWNMTANFALGKALATR